MIETDCPEQQHVHVRHWMPLASAPHQLKSIFHQQQYGKVPRFTYRPSRKLCFPLVQGNPIDAL